MNIVSAVVCTRDRPDSLVRTVRSLLASADADFELLVIDQSDGLESREALGACLSDSRLRYLPSRARGKGAALNEGLREACGDIVVSTDDDCEVPPGWAAGMARALEAQPTAAIVFCAVTAGPHDRASGYIPAFEPRRSRLLCSIGASSGKLGLGAGMAVRRAAVLALGGFDESFGPGARFGSGDDWDVAQRLLLSGWHVYETDHLSIVHHGFRTFAEGSDHARRDWIAIGALCAKPLRAGHFDAIVVPLWYFSVLAVWPPLRDLLRLRKPSGLSRIVGFSRGFRQGLRTPVDRKTLLFRRAH
jgi:glycosyltransferase involved in cell wall biosynthesis